MEQKLFSQRLSQLRINKGVSAREMSLAIGLSPGYINNVETGVNYPSMAVFFYICEYLNITPIEFFDTETKNPTKEAELLSAVKGLSTDNLEHLIAIATSMKRA